MNKRSNDVHTIKHTIIYDGYPFHYATTKLIPSVINSDETRFTPEHQLEMYDGHRQITLNRTAHYNGAMDNVSLYQVFDSNRDGDIEIKYIIVGDKTLYDANGDYYDTIIYEEYMDDVHDELTAMQQFINEYK